MVDSEKDDLRYAVGLGARVHVVIQPLTYNPFFLLACFYLGSFLGSVYILGQVFFVAKSIFRNWKKK